MKHPHIATLYDVLAFETVEEEKFAALIIEKYSYDLH
jgi:hypothetical protein